MSNRVRTSIKASAIAILGFAALSYGSGALACGIDAGAHPASWQDQGSGNAGSLLRQASYTDYVGQPIVGMWSFKMTVGTATVDFGYQQWHSDGTEIENTGGRAPATENFCLGVWHPTGLRRFHLSHYALSYDMSGTLNGKAIITEDVTVDATGMSFTGPITISFYDPNSNALTQQVKGQVTAQRISN